MKKIIVKLMVCVLAVAFAGMPMVFGAGGGIGGGGGDGAVGGGCWESYDQPCMYSELGAQKDLCRLDFVNGSSTCTQGGCGASENTLKCGAMAS